MRITKNGTYGIVEDVVTRVFEDELIIIPITANAGGTDETLFSVSDTARAIWEQLDGKQSVAQLCATLADRYEAPFDVVLQDTLAFLKELHKRRLIYDANAPAEVAAATDA